VHVRTYKGFGYPPAEADDEKFHAPGIFDPASGGTPVASWTDQFSSGDPRD
jgi:deoxyxylulose-5-phosphate synthase